MHSRDQIVPFTSFDEAIESMMTLLASLDLSPPARSTLAEQHRQAFAALYHSTFRDLRSSLTRQDEMRFGASLAGLGDLAAKICAAAALPGGLKVLRPHLRNMIAGSAQMNAKSSSIDAAANKHCELYVAVLALAAGLKVDLEDPESSAGGGNPDLLIEDGQDKWSIAVKALHGSSVPSIFANIRKAASQIETAGRPGVVFLNVKNIVDHEKLQGASPFISAEHAKQAVADELNGITARLRSEIVVDDWEEVFSEKLASRVLVLMAQITVSATIGAMTMFVPIRVMRLLFAPPLAESRAELGDLDHKATIILERLNEELQKIP